MPSGVAANLQGRTVATFFGRQMPQVILVRRTFQDAARYERAAVIAIESTTPSGVFIQLSAKTIWHGGVIWRTDSPLDAGLNREWALVLYPAIKPLTLEWYYDFQLPR